MPRRTAILLIGRVVSAATTVVVLALVGRLRGETELGAVAVGFAVGAILAAVSDLGAGSLLVREASQRPDRAGPFLIGLALVRLLTLTTAIVAAGLVALVIDAGAADTILLVAAGLAVQTYAELTRAFFIARQRFTISAVHYVIENLVWVAVVAVPLVMMPERSTASIFAAGVAVMCISTLAGFVLVYLFGSISVALPTRAELSRLARHAPPFAAFAVLGVASARIDTVMVGLLVPGGLVAAGSYFAATRLVAAFEYVPEAAARGAFPELARRSVDRPSEVAPLLGQATRGLLVIGAAIPAVLLPVGDWLLPTLFDTPADTGWVLAALSVAVPIRYLLYLYGAALTSADGQGKRVAAAVAALTVVVVVNVVAIPIVGLAAPIGSSIAAAITVASMYAVFVRRKFGSLGIEPSVVFGLLIASALGALAGFLARQVAPEPTSVGLGAMAALLVYATLAAAGPARPMLGGLRWGRVPTR